MSDVRTAYECERSGLVEWELCRPDCGCRPCLAAGTYEQGAADERRKVIAELGNDTFPWRLAASGVLDRKSTIRAMDTLGRDCDPDVEAFLLREILHEAASLLAPEGECEDDRKNGIHKPAARAGDRELKCWPVYYDEIERGVKTWTIRRNDAEGFAAGSTLLLREWDPVTGEYTGRQCERYVPLVCSLHPIGLDGWVGMSLAPAHEEGSTNG